MLRKRFLLAIALVCSSASAAAPDLSDFSLPPGFSIEVLVDGVRDARSMAWGDDGTLYIATRIAGKVYAVKEPLSGSPEVIVIAEKLKMPNGVAVVDGDLYVAEVSRISRYPAIGSRLGEPVEAEVIVDDLPTAKLHGWRYIDFGPDGRLYVSIGAPCNVCDEPGTALILRMQRDGSEREVFVSGVRNSVGFDWYPDSGELWFTDNGRDALGDDIPADELNIASEQGLHFGFPYCHAGTIADPDPEIAALGDCKDSVSPAQLLGPHVAALGMRFYTGEQFPEEYHGQLFIAEHGSWNRSEKIGYRISLVRIEDGQPVSYEPFIEGWLRDEKGSGQPVDILVAPDGSLLVSDDRSGVVYRISYSGAF